MDIITEIVNSKFGKFKVFSNDKHITKHIKSNKMMHPTIFDWICSNIKYGGFLDIGANVGLYSISVNKKLGCDVFSIEAHPKTYELLEYNASINSNNIYTYNLGASNIRGTMYMGEIESTPNFNTGDMRLKSIDKYEVQLYRADSIIDLSKKIDVIKIDVQGHDYKSLLGCDGLIKENRPTIIIEWEEHMVSDGSSLKDVHEYLSTYGYKNVGTYERDHMFKVV